MNTPRIPHTKDKSSYTFRYNSFEDGHLSIPSNTSNRFDGIFTAKTQSIHHANDNNGSHTDVHSNDVRPVFYNGSSIRFKPRQFNKINQTLQKRFTNPESSANGFYSQENRVFYPRLQKSNSSQPVSFSYFVTRTPTKFNGKSEIRRKSKQSYPFSSAFDQEFATKFDNILKDKNGHSESSSKSLISSPMSSVYDFSNENGPYFYYVMNEKQRSGNLTSDVATKQFTENAIAQSRFGHIQQESVEIFNEDSENKSLIADEKDKNDNLEVTEEKEVEISEDALRYNLDLNNSSIANSKSISDNASQQSDSEPFSNKEEYQNITQIFDTKGAFDMISIPNISKSNETMTTEPESVIFTSNIQTSSTKVNSSSTNKLPTVDDYGTESTAHIIPLLNVSSESIEAEPISLDDETLDTATNVEEPSVQFDDNNTQLEEIHRVNNTQNILLSESTTSSIDDVDITTLEESKIPFLQHLTAQ
ncbi:hypothetical protein CDAR_295371 [Caerostris darwini]|uniref:Uncharacterized protein n=1 Tax=Caerostris darwini TaxID=1538125 RepID=A0AAV4QWA5_9ARAC|nr:hypothetical protein CDAR_295371 [Caerostris darwini]